VSHALAAPAEAVAEPGDELQARSTPAHHDNAVQGSLTFENPYLFTLSS
jgi:hypothetical protein